MNIWWCIQTWNWEYELGRDFVCSADDVKNITYRKSVGSARKGDLVVHCCKQQIVAISSATEDGEYGEDIEYGLGWCFKTDYFLLENPIELDLFVRMLTPGKFKGYPLNKNYQLNQGYFFPFDEDGLRAILQFVNESKPLPKWLENIKPGNDELDRISQKIEEEFDPSSQKDGREHTLASITRRRGQRIFRDQLLKHYNGRCAVTGCNFKDALEAAHVTPYNGDKTNTPKNGILLRADIHVLWDLDLISIDTKTYTLKIRNSLIDTCYKELDGKKVFKPKQADCHPSIKALLEHDKQFNKEIKN